MATDYYQQMLASLQSLVDSQQWQAAQKLIDEEMAAPYIPAAIATQLEHQQEIVKANSLQPSPPRQLSADQVAAGLRGSGDQIGAVLSFLEGANLRNFQIVLNEYLADDAADRMVAALLFDLGRSQRIEKVWILHEAGKTYPIVPADLAPIGSEPAVASAADLIDQIISDRNPSFRQGCHEVLKQQVLQRYPLNFDGYSAEMIAYGIVRATCLAYGRLDYWQQVRSGFAGCEDSLLKVIV